MNRDWSERIENALIKSRLVNGFASAIQKLLNALFLKTRLRPIKTFLNGTWLEHPLHPLLTDIPVGAWTMAILLDLIALTFGVTNLGVASAIALGLGILAALAAIATGLLDWMDVDPPELAIGITHATINAVATLLFIIAFVVQWTSNWEIRPGDFLPALLGYIILIGGAYLGGSLVFRRGVMINRNAYRSGPKKFVPVLATKDLRENEPTLVDAKGRPVLLVRRGEEVYAIGAVCSHYGAPLQEGTLKDGIITCPWHLSRFSLQDGRVIEGPATAPVPAYEARINDGSIEVREK